VIDLGLSFSTSPHVCSGSQLKDLKFLCERASELTRTLANQVQGTPDQPTRLVIGELVIVRLWADVVLAGEKEAGNKDV
jgi:hypothetical protein